MPSLDRPDDFQTRRAHLKDLSDDELHARFWDLANRIVQPLVAEARTHTTPAVERSVLLRMGFTGAEARDLVNGMQARGLLGCGAGKLVLVLANAHHLTVREAGLTLLEGRMWEELGV
ncbi:MAG: ornithine aminomutase subunit alpha [Alphaproteobacteria bacterium]|nr:ornithine aminomutase subunit alpha [Alphaproteobacteria bacterium]